MQQFFSVNKYKNKMLIKPNYADKNAFSWKAYPVPDTREMGLAPNSHTQWLRGDYAIVGAVLG